EAWAWGGRRGGSASEIGKAEMNLHQPLSRLTPPASPADMIDDRPNDAVFRVSKSIYLDPDIFEMEIERIFSRVWNYVCHESQIRAVGDYVATEIGRQPVFATRSKRGDVKVFFDACAPRGAGLTTRRSGKAPTITCRYHGWCYDTNGKCTKIQHEKLGWPNGMPKDYRTDLTPVP